MPTTARLWQWGLSNRGAQLTHFHPFGETKHTSHIVVVGQAVGCQQTQIPMGDNVLIVHRFSFSAFPMDFLFTPHMAVAERLDTIMVYFAFIMREGLTLMFFVHGAACHRVKGAVGWPHHVTRETGKGHLRGIPFKPILPSVEVGKPRVFHYSQPLSL
ncbi:uncharacterized protein TM35_000051020 [Trypanosoma theileri]|uniref:Uncharacterized protein n=1 Tax=Trypanosoma theileri TaxID=67003 RepID=A0A1X0P3I8_9TRYP|nr:uncharacterized protein TM35_000051020 [Trypanosoma theileri]ORC91506.1 hypothetical protein TM35_000051020 [Trypanosoma theileri]